MKWIGKSYQFLILSFGNLLIRQRKEGFCYELPPAEMDRSLRVICTPNLRFF